MFSVSYLQMVIAISAVWLCVRGICIFRRRKFDIHREMRLLLVYFCLLLLARFAFFPFTRMDGKIQPLRFDRARVFPLRINLIPFGNLRNYPSLFNLAHNILGNTLMFIPVGIVWPAVFKQLNTHLRVFFTGIGLSVTIEVLQLPFYSRFMDIDDLILNMLGFFLGYLIYLRGIKRTKS